mgnify:FL=1
MQDNRLNELFDIIIEKGGDKSQMSMFIDEIKRHIEGRLPLKLSIDTAIEDTLLTNDVIKQYNRLLNYLPFKAWIKGADGRYIACNNLFCSANKMNLWDIIGKSDTELFNSETAIRYTKLDLEVQQSGKDKLYEELFEIGEQKRWVETYKAPLFNDPGMVIGTFGFTRDITDRKEVEEKLMVSEERFRQLAENVDEIFWLMAPDKVLYINPALERYLGISSAELYTEPKNFIKFIHRKDLPLLFKRMNSDSFREHGLINEEIRIVKPNKETRWMWVRTFPIKGIDNRIERIAGIAQDITERKNFTDTVKRSESKYRSLVENLNEWVWELDVEGKYSYCSPQVSDLLGYDPEDVIGKSPVDFMNRQEAFRFGEYFNSIKKYWQRVNNYECRFLNTQGIEIILETSGSPVFDEDGSPCGYRGISRNITERIKNQRKLQEYADAMEWKSFELQNEISERKKAEENLERKDLLLNAVAKAGSKLLVQNELLIALKESLSLFCNAIKAVNAKIYRVSADEAFGIETVEPLFMWDTVSGLVKFKAKKKRDLLFDIEFPFATDLKSELILFGSRDSYQNNFEIGKYLEAKGIYSVIIIPLFIDKVFWGLIEFSDCKSDFTESDSYSPIFRLFGVSISGALKRAQQEQFLRTAKAEADSANKAKSEFLANMSHEIRTPMNAILGFAELLRGQEKNPAYREYINGIMIGGENLMKIINDILDLSKIEAGKMDIKQETVDIYELCNEIRQIFSLNIKNKNLFFDLHIDDNVPRRVLLDGTRMRQVLINLAGNAIKFTEKGGITISLRIKSWLSDGFDLLFEVSDTGKGIPDGQQRLIFEAFKQQEGQNTRKYGGTGLGLTITKRLVEMMNGRISLESEPGRGSSFYILINGVKKSDELLNDNFQRLSESKPDFGGASVVIADDADSNIAVIKGFIEGLNLVPYEAGNGFQALELIKRKKPSLVLLDTNLGDMNGIEILQKLRSMDGTGVIPVIAMTATIFTDDDSSLLNNFDGCLIKPISKSNLIREMKKFLQFTVVEPDRESENEISTDTYIVHGRHTIPESIQKILREKWAEKCEELKMSMFIDEIEEFAGELMHFAEEQNCDALTDYSNRLYLECESFNYDSIKSILNDFKNFVM